MNRLVSARPREGRLALARPTPPSTGVLPTSLPEASRRSASEAIHGVHDLHPIREEHHLNAAAVRVVAVRDATTGPCLPSPDSASPRVPGTEGVQETLGLPC